MNLNTICLPWVGKVNKGKRKMLCILALCKSFAFAQAIVRHKQSHALTFTYLLLCSCFLLYSLYFQSQQRVCHTMALPIDIKKWRKSLYSYPIFQVFLRQKKNYGNSNISPCKNTLIFNKIL
jgi:hypothetical protein